jgi:hypothetical protein
MSKIDSISKMMEVLTYYGNLDKVYTLGLQLTKKSNKEMNNGRDYLVNKGGIPGKKIADVEIKNKADLTRVKKLYRDAYMLFDFKTPILKNKDEIRDFREMIEGEAEGKLLRFTNVFVVLHPSQHAQNSVEFNEHLIYNKEPTDVDLGVDEEYSKLCAVMKDYGMLSRIKSYCSIHNI